MANYSIPNWALERIDDINDYMLKSMSVLVETDQMKRLFSGKYFNSWYNLFLFILTTKSKHVKKEIHI